MVEITDPVIVENTDEVIESQEAYDSTLSALFQMKMTTGASITSVYIVCLSTGSREEIEILVDGFAAQFKFNTDEGIFKAE